MAARHNLPKQSVLYTKNPLPLRGVVVLDGVPNLKSFRQQGINTCEGIDVVGNLLGNTPNQISERYKYASPSDLLPLGVPQILIFGRRDTSVPPSFGYAYTKLARQHGDKVKFITIPFLGHHGSAVPNSLAWPAVRSAVLSLLNIKKN